VAADRFPKPRIVLADPNQRMREAVVRVLNTKCEVEVVGYALDGAGTVDAAIGLHPDILILDIIMPGLDGIRVARMLRRINSPTKIIFLTGIEDSSFQQAAMKAGGQAYVFKASAFTDLPRAITAVMTGGTFFSSKGKL